MKKKHWQVSVFDKSIETIRDDTLYTTDTEVCLVFELIDKNFRPDSTTVTIYNIYGTVTINENVDIVNGIVNYEMPVDAIGHTGGWRTQVVFTKDNEDYTTTIIEFDVDGHLLDNNKPTIVYIENWNSFIKHGEILVDDWEQLEKIRQTNERQRERAESSRQTTFETNEISRQTNELVREEAEGNRQSTFEENEVGRQSEFEENEQGRESAEVIRLASEVDRVNAEIVRKGFYEGFESELGKKANKQQEDWITPTLLNGFTGNVKYRKTQFGHLEIYGTVTSINPINDTPLAVFSLPSGYIPAREVKLEAPENAYYTFRNARVVISDYYKTVQMYSGQGGSRWEINISIPIN